MENRKDIMTEKEIFKKLNDLLDKDIFIGYSLNDSSINPYYITNARDVHHRKCTIINYEHYSIINCLEKAIEIVEQKILEKII